MAPFSELSTNIADFGCTGGYRSLNRNRVHKFETISDADSKIWKEAELENVTPATSATNPIFTIQHVIKKPWEYPKDRNIVSSALEIARYSFPSREVLGSSLFAFFEQGPQQAFNSFAVTCANE